MWVAFSIGWENQFFLLFSLYLLLFSLFLLPFMGSIAFFKTIHGFHYSLIWLKLNFFYWKYCTFQHSLNYKKAYAVCSTIVRNWNSLFLSEIFHQIVNMNMQVAFGIGWKSHFLLLIFSLSLLLFSLFLLIFMGFIAFFETIHVFHYTIY